MPTFSVFGCSISSDWDLPPLEPTAIDRADVFIQQGSVSASGLDSPIAIRPNSQIGHNMLWFEVPGMARFLVMNGQHVRFEPFPGADIQGINLYLLGTCMGVLLHQRGLLVLHASAIQVGGGCVLVAGHSGIGKSTLAAAVQQRGYSVISDDISAINPMGYVLPGYPQIKLWQDSANLLGIDTKDLKRIRTALRKYGLPIKQGFCSKQQPIKAVYTMTTDHLAEYRFLPRTGFAKFEALSAYTYRGGVLEGMGLHSTHLDLCGRLAQQASVYELIRPMYGITPDRLADHIESHWQLQGLLKCAR